MHGKASTAQHSRPLRIVAIGGGTGLPNLLSGLSRQQLPHVQLSAIVTTFDDGGSSGRLRTKYGIPALGDIRRCLLALAQPSPASDAFAEAMNHRFESSDGMPGHSFGNLMLAAWVVEDGRLSVAIDKASMILNLSGLVIPVAIEPAHLHAEMTDGTWIKSETEIDKRVATEPRIKRVALDREVPANPEAISAINDADVIVIGPGDLYTSVVPNLLPTGIASAIRASRARILYICNTFNKPAETSDFSASDYVRTVNEYIGAARINTAIVNEPAGDAVSGDTVKVDDALADTVGEVVVSRLSDATDPKQHDADALAAEVIRLAERTG